MALAAVPRGYVMGADGLGRALCCHAMWVNSGSLLNFVASGLPELNLLRRRQDW